MSYAFYILEYFSCKRLTFSEKRKLLASKSWLLNALKRSEKSITAHPCYPTGATFTFRSGTGINKIYLFTFREQLTNGPKTPCNKSWQMYEVMPTHQNAEKGRTQLFAFFDILFVHQRRKNIVFL